MSNNIMLISQPPGAFFCIEYFYFKYFKYIFSWYLLKIFNAGLLLGISVFYSVVLRLLLRLWILLPPLLRVALIMSGFHEINPSKSHYPLSCDRRLVTRRALMILTRVPSDLNDSRDPHVTSKCWWSIDDKIPGNPLWSAGRSLN